jgi:hypothetical protein
MMTDFLLLCLIILAGIAIDLKRKQLKKEGVI